VLFCSCHDGFMISGACLGLDEIVTIYRCSNLRLIEFSFDCSIAREVRFISLDFSQLFLGEEVAFVAQGRHFALSEDLDRQGLQAQTVFFQAEGLQPGTLGHLPGNLGDLVLVQVHLGDLKLFHLVVALAVGHRGDPVPAQVDHVELVAVAEGHGHLSQPVVGQVEVFEVLQVGAQVVGDLLDQVAAQQQSFQLLELAKHWWQLCQSIARQVQCF